MGAPGICRCYTGKNTRCCRYTRGELTHQICYRLAPGIAVLVSRMRLRAARAPWEPMLNHVSFYK